MAYSICLSINLKKTSLSDNEDLIIHAAYNTERSNIYYDYELEGINNYIKKNNKIIVIEYDIINNFINFLEFIIKFRDIIIDYIYYDNTIVYYSNKYLNSLDKEIIDKKTIKNTVESAIASNKHCKIYKILKVNV